MTNSQTASTAFTLTWTLDAPPAEVFQAWTDPDHSTGSTTMRTRRLRNRSSSISRSAASGGSS